MLYHSVKVCVYLNNITARSEGHTDLWRMLNVFLFGLNFLASPILLLWQLPHREFALQDPNKKFPAQINTLRKYHWTETDIKALSSRPLLKV